MAFRGQVLGDIFTDPELKSAMTISIDPDPYLKIWKIVKKWLLFMQKVKTGETNLKL